MTPITFILICAAVMVTAVTATVVAACVAVVQDIFDK